jgi:hypothetical protein
MTKTYTFAIYALLFTTFIFLVNFSTPVVSAQEGGLVNCSGLDCNACKLVELGNNLIKWLFGIIAFIFGILMLKAGFGLVMSGGDTSALSSAKSLFTNAIIGLLIVMAAWLIVDTIFKTLFNNGGDLDDVSSGWGPWSEIKCTEMTKTVVPGTTPGGVTTVPGDGTPAPGPISTAACTPLTPLTDPLAISMEAKRGDVTIWEKTAPGLEQCAKKFLSLVKGGKVTSAYRPQPYQDHLKEIHTKWCKSGLQSITDPSCSEVKSKVKSELSIHGLSCDKLVGTVSNHTAGRAIDVGGIAHGTKDVLAAAASSCLQWFGSADVVHYELKAGCSCN